MTIKKSKRHSKYIGQFGEALVCNMLSRSGFEVMLVDHVGIDVVAYRRDIERIGISVKSRTRDSEIKKLIHVNLFNPEKDSLVKVCKQFSLEPWLSVYVETEVSADLYMTSYKNFCEKYTTGKSLKMLSWKMNLKHREKYANDPEVKHWKFDLSNNNWFS